MTIANNQWLTGAAFKTNTSYKVGDPYSFGGTITAKDFYVDNKKLKPVYNNVLYNASLNDWGWGSRNGSHSINKMHNGCSVIDFNPIPAEGNGEADTWCDLNITLPAGTWVLVKCDLRYTNSVPNVKPNAGFLFLSKEGAEYKTINTFGTTGTQNIGSWTTYVRKVKLEDDARIFQLYLHNDAKSSTSWRLEVADIAVVPLSSAESNHISDQSSLPLFFESSGGVVQR